MSHRTVQDHFRCTKLMMAEFNDGISDSQLVAAAEKAEADLEVDRMRETDETASDIELCEALDVLKP
jgi:hypothetical protein